MVQLARSFSLNQSMALHSDIIQYSIGDLLYLLPRHLQFYRIHSTTHFSWYSLNIMYIVHGYKSLLQQMLKLFCRQLVLALASNPHQYLSKNKDTGNFTTAVFKMEISSLY